MNLTERRHILSLLAEDHERVSKAAVATIVRTEGSTYRRPGARLLVDATGTIAGNLSGGCLESEMVIEADKVLSAGIPSLVLYDLSAEDEAIWGWGLGCNGTMEVFIEPAMTWTEPARFINAALEKNRAVGVATILTSPVETEVAAHVVIDRDGSIAVSSGDPGWDEAMSGPLFDAVDARESRLISLGERRVFLEPLLPADTVVIFGAGHDAAPVAELSSYLGFEVVMVDERATLLSKDRFPHVNDFYETTDLHRLFTDRADSSVFAVVMSHNYLKDLDALEMLAAHRLSYLGLLGPRKRSERLLKELRRKGIAIDDKLLETLHGPAGLDLGGEGPEEVAMAIAAELLAVRQGRQGGFLRNRAAPIHEDPK